MFGLVLEQWCAEDGARIEAAQPEILVGWITQAYEVVSKSLCRISVSD